jgi:protein-L-isoaspartate(D-aspartate) O-methyltransferase
MVDNEYLMEYMLALRNQGVSDKAVLIAMEKVPRHLFMAENFREHAYRDAPFPIASGQTISQPSVVGKMTQALNVGSRDKVLEIGTGSGFQAAVLSHLARRVYSVERHAGLARTAQKVLQETARNNVVVITGDGSLGLPDQAPFDRILLTAAAEDPPANLLAQLRMGGIMVLPVGQSDAVQTLIRIEKTDDGLHYTELEDVRFVPLLEGVERR